MIGTTRHSTLPFVGYFTDDELYSFIKPLKVRTVRQFLGYVMENVDLTKSKTPENISQVERVLARLHEEENS